MQGGQHIQPDNQRYIRLSVFTGIVGAVEATFHIINRHNWIKYPPFTIIAHSQYNLLFGKISLEDLVGALAYLFVALWGLVLIAIIYSYTEARYKHFSPAIIWNPPRDIHWIALIAGVLGTVQVIPYVIAVGLFDPSIVIPLSSARLIYLLVWEKLIAPYFIHRPYWFGWLRLTPSTTPIRDLWFPVLILGIGLWLTTAMQRSQSFNITALWLVAGIQQFLETARTLADQQGGLRVAQHTQRQPALRTDLLDNTLFVWRSLWWAVSTTVVVLVFALKWNQSHALWLAWSGHLTIHQFLVMMG